MASKKERDAYNNSSGGNSIVHARTFRSVHAHIEKNVYSSGAPVVGGIPAGLKRRGGGAVAAAGTTHNKLPERCFPNG